MSGIHRGPNVGHVPDLVPYPTIFAMAQSATATDYTDPNGNPVQWIYDMAECYKRYPGYSSTTQNAWQLLPDGLRFSARNWFEDRNFGTGRQGNGINVDGDLWGSVQFAIQPIQPNRVVPCWWTTVGDTGEMEYWFYAVNMADGEC